LARLGVQHDAGSFPSGLEQLADELGRVGKASETFPSAIATTWLHITEDTGKADRMLTNVLAPMLHRPVDELRSAPLLIGPPAAERVAAFIEAGARRIFVWPLVDESRQLELFREHVISRFPRAP
jgi:hypothetical protein